MKTFKGVVFAWFAFDLYLQINDVINETQYPVFEKGADLIKNIFCLNNDWKVIFSKAEKFLICGKTFIALPSYMVKLAYWLTAIKQLSDMRVL